MDPELLEAMNESRGTRLAWRIRRAATFATRLRGLLGRDALDEGEGLLIEPCSGIHTFFMRFSIDVLFLDDDGRVVQALDAVAPWRASRIYPKARKVLELPAGTSRGSATVPGDRIAIFRAGAA